MPGKHGGTLRRGNPGHKGAGGRPRNDYRTRCGRIVNGKGARVAIQAIAEDPEHPQCVAAQRMLADRAYGRPVESLEVSGPDKEPLRIVWDDA
jgi:ribosomal protein L34E